RRFRGTWIGYEFSRRVSELLAAKAEDGVLTETGRGGYYLKSAKAAEKWEDLKRWIAQVNQGDAHFGIKIEDGQPQDAALIYMVRDLKIDIGSGFSSFAQWNEETMLRERGFFN